MRGALKSVAVVGVALVLAAGGTGCLSQKYTVPTFEAPRELVKVNHPEYRIEPPDILQIDAIQAMPLPPYKVKPLDVLTVSIPAALPDAPIKNVYPVDPDGMLDFGPDYPKVKVNNLTIPEVKTAIETTLKNNPLKEPKAEVTLYQGRGVQQIRGQHLVRPDGTVSLGQYGSVNVSGATIPEAKARVETHLKQYLQDPEVTIDVLAFNSKVYYVILDGGGAGQQVARLPSTGNETVLDAISQVSGLTTVSDAHRIWVSRPGPDGCESVLPVDWNGITMCGKTGTNYQILPGDRVFVKAYPMTTLDTTLARVFAPIERVLGISLLGASLRTQFNTNSFNNNNIP
jgi:polysaccharide export outer membrane protein